MGHTSNTRSSSTSGMAYCTSLRQRLPTDARIVAAIILPTIWALMLPIFPHDLWWHLAYGREIAQTGQIPSIDSWSITHAGDVYIDQPWLAQVLLYGVHQAGGPVALVLLRAVCIAVSCLLLMGLCRQASGDARTTTLNVILLLLLPLAMSNWAVRPHLLSIPLFSAYLAVLWDWPRHPRRLILLPPLMTLWVNLHGAFALGLGLLVLVTLIDTVRWWRIRPAWSLWPLLLVSVVTLLSVGLNPQGWGIVGYVGTFAMGAHGTSALVEEWQPSSLATAAGGPFLLILGVCGVVLLARGQRIGGRDLVLLAAFSLFGLIGQRYVIWAALVAAPILTRALAPLWEVPAAPARASWGWGALALLGALVLTLGWLTARPDAQTHVLVQTPIAATTVLLADPHPPMHLFAAPEFGGYLKWRGVPARLAIDTRFELYTADEVARYRALGAGLGVRDVLAAERFDAMLLSLVSQAPLIARMRVQPGWRVQYEDATAVYLRLLDVME
jgi:hypothetical protein